MLGDIDVGSGRVDGSLGARGRLVADDFTLGADSEILGPVRVQKSLVVGGETRLGADLTCGELSVRGRLQVHGEVRVDGSFRLDGALEARGEVTVKGAFGFEGRVTIGGTLTAGAVDGRHRGESRLDSIRADSVSLRRAGGLGDSRSRLRLLRIEAREVRLEAVTCEYVRCEKLLLGPASHVVRVDGTVVEQHSTAHLGPEAPFVIPRGLFR